MTEKTDKPVVFYHGEAAFSIHPSGAGVAVVRDVVGHPYLGNEKVVYTSQVLRRFDGGFETLNTIYIQLDKKYDPELAVEDENS